MSVGAVVLAGGRSSRFGRDKLVEPMPGGPLLALAVDALRPIVDEIVVVVSPGSNLAAPAGTRLVQDPRPFEGPLAGLSAGLAALTADVVIVVGGDMPTLVPAVLARLLGALDEPAADDASQAAVLETGGAHRPLPMAVRRVPARAVADDLLARGERRLRALRDGLRLAVVLDADWRRDDPDGRTLRDVDTVADL